MHLKPFDYLRPASLAELRSVMKEMEPGSFVLVAGGTDMTVKLKQRRLSPRLVISLSGIGEMKKLGEAGDHMMIGACITLSELEDAPAIVNHFPALAQAARLAASPQLRNMGTLGGNICLDTRCLYVNQQQWPGAPAPCYKRGGARCHVVKGSKRCYALFSADTPAALLAYGARLCLIGPAGEREVPIDEFYRDDGLECCIKDEKEVILGVKFPIRTGREGCYVRFSRRGAIDFPLVGVAIVREHDPEGQGVVFKAAATGVQSCPVRLGRLEEILAEGTGIVPGPLALTEEVRRCVKTHPTAGTWPRELTEEVRRCVKTHPTAAEIGEGVRGIKIAPHPGMSPSYRREIMKVLIERALAQLTLSPPP